METSEKEFSPQESLQLIQSMINKTKNSVADSSFYLLFWGWLVFGCCIAEYILKVQVQYQHHYIVWYLMPVGGIISGIYGSRQSKKQKIKTFVEEAIDYVWIGLGISFIVILLISMNGNGWQTAFSYYIMIYGIGTFVTGSLIRFRPLVIGGIINFIIAAFAAHFSYDNQLLICAFALVTSYIIPGHLLRIRYHKNQQ